MLHLIMEDDIDSNEYPSNADIKTLVEHMTTSSTQRPSDSEVLNIANAGNKKTTAWMHAACRKLVPSIQSLQKLIGNKNRNIRKELASFATCLLTWCSR